MSKFDLGKLDGVMGIGFLGGVISCFIVYMVCNIVSKIPESLPETIETALLIGFNTMITGICILVVACIFLISNTIRTRTSKSEGTPTWHVLFVFILVGIVIVLSFLIPQVLF